jgi:hypothetical protein
MRTPSLPRSKCWNCDGSGRVRDEGLFEDRVAAIFSCGLIPALRWLCESDDGDDRFWSDCDVCGGRGWLS